MKTEMEEKSRAVTSAGKHEWRIFIKTSLNEVLCSQWNQKLANMCSIQEENAQCRHFGEVKNNARLNRYIERRVCLCSLDGAPASMRALGR